MKLITHFSVFMLLFSASMAVTPDEALQSFKDGNLRYSTGKPVYPDQSPARRTETSIKGQHPSAMVLSCSDSRVPVETIFDMGIGDVFVIRVAGNIADPTEMASMEYGAEHLEVPLLIVLGHTKCGAVTAAVKGGEAPGHLPHLLDNIKPAVDEAKHEHSGMLGDELVLETVKLNVFQSIKDILTKSEILRTLVKEGKLKIVGGLYNIETGNIDWLGGHSQESSFLASALVSEKPSVETKHSEIKAVVEESHSSGAVDLLSGKNLIIMFSFLIVSMLSSVLSILLVLKRKGM